jgi:NAD-dependent deacetylase
MAFMRESELRTVTASLPAALELARYHSVVVLTGAGVSVASGLPTYRGAGGLWDTIDVGGNATAAAVEAAPARVWAFFAGARAKLVAARPNAAHLAIAQAEARLRSDQRLTVLTQNVDGLHALAGSRRVVELHGTLHRTRCTRCEFSRDEDLATSPAQCPSCPRCSAALRPAVVLFDEALPVDAEWEAKKALRDCDLFLAVGTSGSVWPASSFVRSAEYAGARTIYVNLEPLQPANPAFQETYLGRAEELLPRLLAGS